MRGQQSCLPYVRHSEPLVAPPRAPLLAKPAAAAWMRAFPICAGNPFLATTLFLFSRHRSQFVGKVNSQTPGFAAWLSAFGSAVAGFAAGVPAAGAGAVEATAAAA